MQKIKRKQIDFGGTNQQCVLGDGSLGKVNTEQADWNENNPSAEAYVKNRTHYVDYELTTCEITDCYAHNDGGEYTQFMINSISPDVTIENTNYIKHFMLNSMLVTLGEIRKFSVDGEELEAYGNLAILNTLGIPERFNDTGEDFVLIFAFGIMFLGKQTVFGTEFVNGSIGVNAENVHTLDNKFLENIPSSKIDNLHPVATSGSYYDLNSRPTALSEFTNDRNFVTQEDIPAQQQSDWNESNQASPAFIKNKPTIESRFEILNHDGTFESFSSAINAMQAGKIYINPTLIIIPPSSNLWYNTKWRTNQNLYINQNAILISTCEDVVQNWEGGAYCINPDSNFGKNSVKFRLEADGWEFVEPIFNNVSENMIDGQSNLIVDDEHHIPSSKALLQLISNFITLQDVPAGQEQADWNQTAVNDPSYIRNKPRIPNDPIQNVLTLKVNNVTQGTFIANSSNQSINIPVPYTANDIGALPTGATAADVGALPDTTKYGKYITASLTSGQLWITLKDQDNNLIGGDVVYLDTVVSGISYDAANQSLIITTLSGSGSVSLTDLQKAITSNNKLSADLITDGSTNKVINVKPDWNAASGNAAEILNKPTIPDAVSGTNDGTNWTSLTIGNTTKAIPSGGSGGSAGTLDTTATTAQSTNSSESLSGSIILHKIAKTGSYTDLTNKPTIPAAQVQSDWNATSGMGVILNKPTIPSITGKADKVSNATNNNFAALDSNGNLKDSGHKHSDYLTTDGNGFMSGGLIKFDGSGNAITTDILASSVSTAITNSHTHSNKTILDYIPSSLGIAGQALVINSAGTGFEFATISGGGGGGDSLPSQSGNSGKFLTTNGTTASWAEITSEIPSQTNNSGKYLSTNGTTVYWASNPIPVTTNNGGKVLMVNNTGTAYGWSTLSGALPSVTASDNGKIMQVVNGSWSAVSPVTIYTGSSAPSSSTGSDGDIYIQTT